MSILRTSKQPELSEELIGFRRSIEALGKACGGRRYGHEPPHILGTFHCTLPSVRVVQGNPNSAVFNHEDGKAYPEIMDDLATLRAQDERKANFAANFDLHSLL